MTDSLISSNCRSFCFQVDREKMGKAGMSGTVSHRLILVSCPFFDVQKLEKEREE